MCRVAQEKDGKYTTCLSTDDRTKVEYTIMDKNGRLYHFAFKDLIDKTARTYTVLDREIDWRLVESMAIRGILGSNNARATEMAGYHKEVVGDTVKPENREPKNERGLLSIPKPPQ